MKIYNYNIRCKICNKGFNPKDKQNVYSKICPKCFKNKAKYMNEAKIETSS
ncbi:MAG: hypothetical protein PHN56_06345 [Candidatus Nanoarchaeia archaeon]|nr:hypothetical protein [Candidatus Nanoarchaeia archaeon]